MSGPFEILPQGVEVMCDCGWSGKSADLVEVPAIAETTCPNCRGEPSDVLNHGADNFSCACGWIGCNADLVPFMPVKPRTDRACPVYRGDSEETLTHVFELGAPRTCIVCGCTDDNCSQCIEATGDTCVWILHPDYDEQDICSRCALEAVRLVLALDKLTGPKVHDPVRIWNEANEWRASLGEHHARGETAAEACKALEVYLAIVAERERRQMTASTLVANLEALAQLGAVDGRRITSAYPNHAGKWSVAFGDVTGEGDNMAEAIGDLVRRISPPLPEGSLDGSD